jgi:hypothetical protein
MDDGPTRGGLVETQRGMKIVSRHGTPPRESLFHFTTGCAAPVHVPAGGQSKR